MKITNKTVFEEQIKLIENFDSGDKINFENIIAKVPDGSIRNHGTMILIIE